MASFCSGLDLFVRGLSQSGPGSRLVKLRVRADLCVRTYRVRKSGLMIFSNLFFYAGRVRWRCCGGLRGLVSGLIVCVSAHFNDFFRFVLLCRASTLVKVRRSEHLYSGDIKCVKNNDLRTLLFLYNICCLISGEYIGEGPAFSALLLTRL